MQRVNGPYQNAIAPILLAAKGIKRFAAVFRKTKQIVPRGIIAGKLNKKQEIAGLSQKRRGDLGLGSLLCA
jgi:hypothetical protein